MLLIMEWVHWGRVLQQADSKAKNKLMAVAFFTRKVNPAEQKFSTIEREALSVIYGLQVNPPSVLSYLIEIHTDH